MNLVMEWYREPLLGWLYLQVQYQKVRCGMHQEWILMHEIPARKFIRPRIRIISQSSPCFYKNWEKDEKPHWYCGIHVLGRDQGRDHKVISVNPRYSDWIMDAVYAYNVKTTNNRISRKDVLIWNPRLEEHYLEQRREHFDRMPIAIRKIMQFATLEQSLFN